MRRWVIALATSCVLAMTACGHGGGPTRAAAASTTTTATTVAPGTTSSSVATTSSATATTVTTGPPAQPRISSDPATMADDLVTDERTLRDPSASEDQLVRAARRQQVTYRALGRHPEWDAITRPLIPTDLLAAYDHNVDARRQFTAMPGPPPREELPTWRIDPPLPINELLGYYREAEQQTGVDWTYLAAIHLVETGLGRIVGLSYAGARGPMQFMPATFEAYGEGDIESAHDSIIAAGRYLAANGFTAGDIDGALWHYNHSEFYVQAVKDYATVLASEPAAYNGYYRWDVYYFTVAGDIVLPVGFVATEPVPVADYLATHPQ